jgi:hypothetical protein
MLHEGVCCCVGGVMLRVVGAEQSHKQAVVSVWVCVLL